MLNMHDQNATYFPCNAICCNIMPYDYISTKCQKHICQVCIIQNTCHAIQSITILCHIIAYQQNIAKYYNNITCMNNLIQGMVQQIGKSSLLNNQCKIDLVGNGSKPVYSSISATYISIPNLWEDINIVYKP
jgi:hypothetical protein